MKAWPFVAVLLKLLYMSGISISLMFARVKNQISDQQSKAVSVNPYAQRVFFVSEIGLVHVFSVHAVCYFISTETSFFFVSQRSDLNEDNSCDPCGRKNQTGASQCFILKLKTGFSIHSL